MLVTNVLMRYLKCTATSWRHKVDRTTSAPWRLSIKEKQELRRDMTEFSTWAKARFYKRVFCYLVVITCYSTLVLAYRVD